VHPIRDRFIYAATKGAVSTMTTSLASDFVLDGIRQCALSLAHYVPC
jgi:NAD(P)-dependent dehydrogenase (short-subunit alcohol dehydrogenase family)